MAKLPSKPEILQWIADNPTETDKRSIARAFGLKGAAKIDLKRLLRELQDEGHLDKRRKTYRDPNRLPPVSVLAVTGPDRDGDLLARPMDWQGDGPEPVILIVGRSEPPALGEGDRILARLTEVAGEPHSHEARVIRRIGQGPQKIIGIYRAGSDGGRILPIDKGADREWRVSAGAAEGAKDGELVEAEATGPKGRMGLQQAKVRARLGDPSGPRAVSLIAIHQHGIPDTFPPEVLAEAEAMSEAGPEGREDLAGIPLITIDPIDARDRDDAVCAHADDDPKNPGGHIVWVAIADVAHYVRPGSALDAEAWKRGNSSYFPDRVVPMLHDHLSGDLCSLHENVPRACVAVRMQIDAGGNKIAHRFVRGLMRSPAALNYQEVQDGVDGKPGDKVAPLMKDVITPLFAAWRTTLKARVKRQPLELDLPERRIELDDDGTVTSVAFKERLDAHRLIEEFMVLANVAAAETLAAKKQALLYRVHEAPSPEKLEALREVAQASGLTLAKGQVLKTSHLNRLLAQAEGSDHAELINISTLRSMTQAYYSPDNLGHFGLALRAYAHFTSPIRRYADLIVHRALIAAHGWADDGLAEAETQRLPETAIQISMTERRSMEAERDTTDRYLAAFLSERVGAELTGRVAGIARFGVFVKLDETGADGLIPIRTLGREYFRHDADAQTLTGSDSGLVITLGQRVLTRLAEAVPVTGGLMLELLEIDGKAMPKPQSRPGRPGKSGKSKRKIRRNRR
ncbi:MAG: ribonuclease R [Rhodobacteraceae bacterium]|nr:ribonuclease R [Paracoccaceae bacterium]